MSFDASVQSPQLDYGVVDPSTYVVKVYVRLRQESMDGQPHELWDGIVCERFSAIENMIKISLGVDDEKEWEDRLNVWSIIEGVPATESEIEFVRNGSFTRWLNHSWERHRSYRAGIAFKCVLCTVMPILYKKGFEEIKFLTHGVDVCLFDDEIEQLKAKKIDQDTFLSVCAEKWRQRTNSNAEADCFRFELVETANRDADEDFYSVMIFLKPDKSSQLIYSSRKDVRIDAVTLKADKVVITWGDLGQPTPNPNPNPNPQDDDGRVVLNLSSASLSLADYQVLSKAGKGIEVEIEAQIDKKNRKVLYKLPEAENFVKIETDKKWIEHDNSYILLMDMGSTRTKYIEFPVLGGDKIDLSKFDVSDRQQLKTTTFLSAKHLETGLSDEDLPNFKEIMAKGCEKYAAFLIGAIRQLAYDAASRSRIYRAVYWSFPKLKGMDEMFFSNVQDRVRASIADCVLAPTERSFTLMPEHEALRNMYENCIAKFVEIIARGNEQFLRIRDSYKRRIQQDKSNMPGMVGAAFNKDKKNLRKALKSDIKINEKMAIEHERSYRECVASNFGWEEVAIKFWLISGTPQDAGSSTLLVDAGGFTTDVFCKVEDKVVDALCASYKAGGEPLLRKIHECLRKARAGKNRIDISEDEDFAQFVAKVRSSDFEILKDLSDEKSVEAIEEAFKAIYQDVTTDIAGMLVTRKKNNQSKVGAVVLSGGVSQNKHFRNCIVDNLKLDNTTEKWRSQEKQIDQEIDSSVPMVNASVFHDVILQIPGFQKEIWFDLFLKLVSTSYDKVEGACSDFDIVGGMLQYATGCFNAK